MPSGSSGIQEATDPQERCTRKIWHGSRQAPPHWDAIWHDIVPVGTNVKLKFPTLGINRGAIKGIAEIETNSLISTRAVINALPQRAGAYRERTGFMAELRRDGRDL